MIRGTTAPFKFKLPHNFSDLIAVKVIFWQDNNDGPSASRPLPIIKRLQQCSPTDISNELFVSLSQEETLRFKDDRKAYVQLFGKILDAPVFGRKPYMFTVYPTGDDSVMEDEIIPTPSVEDEYIIINGGEVGGES